MDTKPSISPTTTSEGRHEHPSDATNLSDTTNEYEVRQASVGAPHSLPHSARQVSDIQLDGLITLANANAELATGSCRVSNYFHACSSRSCEFCQ